MKTEWKDRKNILCIRLDNMGDVLMSSPAIAALKETFNCSTMAAQVCKYIPCIDEVIIANVPWIKSEFNDGVSGYQQLVETLRRRQFDAAVVFTVFSQNPLPAVMLAYLAEIPLRLAYCRENPYELITHWVPDAEPYSTINHQVERDLQLVRSVGAKPESTDLRLNIPNPAYSSMMEKITAAGLDTKRPWMIVHPGASEPKRLFPPELFNSILKKIIERQDMQMLLTGTINEKLLTEQLRSGICSNSVSVAGQLSLEEFMAAIDIAPVVLSVNTSTVHIAAALNTPVIVLYAMTNPQHTPWNVPHEVFPFPVPPDMQSKNEVLRYVSLNIMEKCDSFPDAGSVATSVIKLMRTAHLLHA
jgi:ADP-heptose:LPS heptosyltransferase